MGLGPTQVIEDGVSPDPRAQRHLQGSFSQGRSQSQVLGLWLWTFHFQGRPLAHDMRLAGLGPPTGQAPQFGVLRERPRSRTGLGTRGVPLGVCRVGPGDMFPPPGILSFLAAAGSEECSVLHGSWALRGPRSAPCQVRTHIHREGGGFAKSVCRDGFEKKLAELNRS